MWQKQRNNMYKSLEQTYRRMRFEAYQPKAVESIFEDFEGTDEQIADLKRRIFDAKNHHRRCQIQLKIIDNP